MAQNVLLRKFQDSYLKLWSQGIKKFSAGNFEKDEKDIIYIKSVNEVKLLGYVGNNPKKYQQPLNKFFTYFSLATVRYYFDKSEVKQRVTTWHTIIVRKPYLQEYVMKYIAKGTRTYISGYIDDCPIDFNGEPQTRGPAHVVANEVICLKKPAYSHNEESPYLMNEGESYRMND